MKTIFTIFIVTLTATLIDFRVTGNIIEDIGKFLNSDNEYKQIAEESSKDMNKETANDIVSQLFQVGDISRTRLPEMVHKDGYHLESYYITTKDGYIMNMFRIPHGRTGKMQSKVVLLQHGLFLAATDYVLFGPEQGLAYYLADHGFDVWMMNCRGNVYSRNHTTLDPEKDKEFWMYSWHEIAIYDTPASIDFVLEKTGNKTLYHVGHSQGTTAIYVLLSIKPEYNEKISHHISLGPTAFMQHLYSPFMRLVAPSSSVTLGGLDQLGVHEFMPTQGFLKDIGSYLCSEGEGRVLCKNFLFLLAGYSPNEINVSSIPLIASHYPAGASTRQILHYCQEYNSGKFAQYDFGVVKNLLTYLRTTPPDYDLSEITTGITLIYSSNDWLCAKVDVEKLAKLLPNVKRNILVPIPTWNHLDFVFGKDAPEVIYPEILTSLSMY